MKYLKQSLKFLKFLGSLDVLIYLLRFKNQLEWNDRIGFFLFLFKAVDPIVSQIFLLTRLSFLFMFVYLKTTNCTKNISKCHVLKRFSSQYFQNSLRMSEQIKMADPGINRTKLSPTNGPQA